MRSFSQGRSTSDARAGFTLVELLAVILIVTLLAAFLLFAMFGVQRDAQITRTRAQIAKLREIVFNVYDSYSYRALPVKIPAGTQPAAVERIRLNCLRELMRLELPDRISDVTSAVATQANPVYYQGTAANPGLSALPSRNVAYRRLVVAGWTAQNEGAECLYMIVRQSQNGGEPAIDFFTQSEIGDTDGDGVPEILDGFGRPIEFLRWAPGYISDLQVTGSTVHDSFDRRNLEPNSYILFPLIYSGGPDRELGINTGGAGFNYVTSATTVPNPYTTANSSLIGTQDNNLSKDNIDNHSQDVK